MKDLWRNVLDELELEPEISTVNFKTWLSETELEEIDQEQAVIRVKNTFVKTQIQNKYLDFIKKSLSNNNFNPKNIIFIINQSRKPINREESIEDKKISSKTVKKDFPFLRTNNFEDNLNSKYTFENFVVGSNNDLAYSAAEAVAENPGQKHNPLYFYGGVGLGKTHLMQAIGNKIKEIHPELKVLYITIENFYRDYLENVRRNKQGYADKYRNVDVLIIDDIQFISGKEKTQIEFFHTFNELHQANKQIILSSDRSPKSIPTLTDRLKSRFEWGMTIDIQLPDFETRQAIIRAKSENSGFTLDEEVIEFLSSNIKTNIRELEGTLNQLIAIAELRNIKPDIELAKGIINIESRVKRPQHLSYKKIIEKTCKFYNISKDDITSKSRTKDINHARQVACYLMKYELKMSFPQIGKIFERDHSTIMNGVSKIEKCKKNDIEIRNQIESLSELIYE